ncbi:hypothetical protein [Streptococcus oriscaviae]|uniref:Phage protein n=1 Tax=Streptococcus oriscaviae TaxID=2781599 RepID=A0ABX7YJD2_9STRE|nr:hypothetical protein [Streptococcus oriscaviae]QUE53567.1 hypothetical protein INT76_06800 [Streptococcus oriscaviae]
MTDFKGNEEFDSEMWFFCYILFTITMILFAVFMILYPDVTNEILKLFIEKLEWFFME